MLNAVVARKNEGGASENEGGAPKNEGGAPNLRGVNAFLRRLMYSYGTDSMGVSVFF